MPQVLVLYDNHQIKAWLIGESLESVEAHIRNGYPELLEDYEAGIVKAAVIDVPDEDAFRDDMYEAVDGIVKRKENL